jgi:hypothetical protein
MGVRGASEAPYAEENVSTVKNAQHLPHNALRGRGVRGGAGKRSQWDRKEKEYALGGKPQTET